MLPKVLQRPQISANINSLIEEIIHASNYQVEQGNAIKHHHDISTLETRTEYGLRFCIASDIIHNLYGIPYGEKGNRLLSFVDELRIFIKLAKKQLTNTKLLDECD